MRPRRSWSPRSTDDTVLVTILASPEVAARQPGKVAECCELNLARTPLTANLLPKSGASYGQSAYTIAIRKLEDRHCIRKLHRADEYFDGGRYSDCRQICRIILQSTPVLLEAIQAKCHMNLASEEVSTTPSGSCKPSRGGR